MIFIVALLFIGLAIILLFRQSQDSEKMQATLRRKETVDSLKDLTEPSKKNSNVYSQLLRERIIFLGEPISPDSANRIVAQLLFLEEDDPYKDIYLYINSPGGSVYDGLGIFDTIQHVKPDVHTVCIGLAAGMAAFLLCSGTKGKRSSLINGTIMLCTPTSHKAESKLATEEISFVTSRLNQELADRTGQPLKKLEKDTQIDFYLSATEAISYGVIDRVFNQSSNH